MTESPETPTPNLADALEVDATYWRDLHAEQPQRPGYDWMMPREHGDGLALPWTGQADTPNVCPTSDGVHVDVVSAIHQFCNADWSGDDFNDWAEDLATEILSVMHATPAAPGSSSPDVAALAEPRRPDKSVHRPAPRGGSVSKLCDPCRFGHHSKCAGEPTFALMCSCHWCKQWVDTHGPFSVPEDTTPEEEA